MYNYKRKDAVEDSLTIKPDNQRSTTEQPKDWSTVTKELIDHLRGMQLNVFGRDAMQQYFKEHPNSFVQQAIKFYGKEKPYLNSKYKRKKSEILDIVKSNKYNNPGTDVVTLESEKHKTIYLIDHSADRELEDNLKRGDGFGIRRAYNLNKITKNDI